MRLINALSLVKEGTLDLVEFAEDEKPKYAILSHRWGAEEATLLELTDSNTFFSSNTSSKEGYRKIQDAANVAVQYGCDWLWCDTCCIDKKSSAELSEAINSMYRWYRYSHLCLAYLADIPHPALHVYTDSVWFKRAWTLQELIAPVRLIFFDGSWRPIGTKHDLADSISKRTGISVDVLQGYERLEKCSIAQRMSWAAGREATRTEDLAYSLLGVFDVNMPMLYGEGRRAFERLQEEVLQRSVDQSVFVWFSDLPTTGLFATKPSDFAECGKLAEQEWNKRAFTLNNLGLDIELTLRPYKMNTYEADLTVVHDSRVNVQNCSLRLEIDMETGYLFRSGCSLKRSPGRSGPQRQDRRRLSILRTASRKSHESTTKPTSLYGFHVVADRVPMTLVNSWEPSHQWDLGKWTGDASKNNFTFKIPESITQSIAMIKLSLGRDTFLVQLTYDFDFNPSCHISKMTLDFSERFRSRYQWTEQTYNDMFDWTTRAANWNAEMRYRAARFDDPTTKQPCWAIISKDRQGFEATVPAIITKPHSGLVVGFKRPSGRSKDWQFDVEYRGTMAGDDLMDENALIEVEDVGGKVTSGGDGNSGAEAGGGGGGTWNQTALMGVKSKQEEGR